MTPQESLATIQPGDWVKLRKKSVSAPVTKRGDTFKVDFVHPVDGSLRIWNPTTKEWGFLYPDEVKLIPAPQINSVTPEPVTESNPPDDSVTPEPVTELNPPDDSVTRAISRYRPKGTARGGEYFRFSYRDGGKVRHIHIRGGNTDSPIAQAKVQEVRSLLASGMPPSQIASMLQGDRSTTQAPLCG